MKRNDWKRLVTGTMAVVMACMTAGCANETTSTTPGTTTSEVTKTETTGSTETPSKTETKRVGWAADLGDQEWTGEQATLTLISEYSGDIESTAWIEDEYRKYTGVTFQRESGANNKVDTILASGQLTDIIGFQYTEKAVAAAESGLLLNLEDYKDQLPNVFDNPLMESALQFVKDNKQGTAEGLYILPLSVGNNDSTTGIPMIRYDVYEEIGSPEPENMEEYFQMLKDMSDAHPTAVDGEKCYAILGWSDWKDSLAGQDFMPYYGWFKLNNTTFAKGDGSTVTSIFDESMPMKNYLKQLNNLWNEGYIHPDSVNMDYSTAKAKIDSGHGLITAVEWMGGKYNDLSTDETGNMTVWAKDFEVYINSDSPVGSNRVLAISKDCTNIDAALRFINWYYSPTAYNIIKNGPEGYLWEYADDGTQVFKEDGIERYRTNREEIGSGGDLFVAQQFINEQPYTAYVINPTTGQPLYHEYWDSFYETEQRWGQLEWRKQTGYTRTVDMAAAQGAKTKSTAFSLMPSIDPSLEATNTAIADAWYTYSWKLLMAKDDVEFEALWKEFEKDCKDLGDDATFEWYKTEFEKAQTQADKYPLNKTWE